MSQDATTLLRFLAEYGEGDNQGNYEFTGPEIVDGLGWSPLRANDVVAILGNGGLLNVETMEAIGHRHAGGCAFDSVTLNAYGRAEYQERWPHGSSGRMGGASKMKDIEVQDLFLKKLYENNRERRGAAWPAMDIAEAVGVHELAQVEDVVNQLNKKVLLILNGNTPSRGRLVGINENGIEQVESGGITGDIEKLFEQHVVHNSQVVHVHDSKGVQVAQGGSPTQTNITYQDILTQMLQLIDDDASIPAEKKEEAKGAVRRLIEHPLLNTIVSGAINVGTVIGQAVG